MKKFCLFFFLMCALLANAQDPKHTIKGRIFDLETALPIEKVAVVDKKSGAGTVTDSSGSFVLKLSFPAELSVSHISYEPRTISIDKAPDSLFYIRLQRSSTELPGISVVPGKAENITKNRELSVMDYEFMGENVLVLAQSTRFSKPSLILLDDKFDTLALQLLDIHPEFIFRDCMNKLHLVEKDFAYQLNFYDRRINLLYPTTYENLNEKLSPCVTTLNEKFYFREFTNKGLSLLYFFTDSIKKQINVINVISDRKKLNMLESEVAFATMPGHKYEEWDKHFFDSMVVTKVYAPLVKLHDTIYVFNFQQGQIEQYAEGGNLLHTVPVSFHEQRTWKNNILVDETENECYAMFQKNNSVQLKRINITTGEVESTTDFSGFPFADNIKIRSGFVYFLYPDASRHGYERLYRKRL